MKIFLLISMLGLSINILSQQVDIERITQMPDFPQPYEMRDWKRIAQEYDSLVYNENFSGEYLPLIENFENSVNYPGFPSFGLHTYVGTINPLSGEAINVIPSVVGASLCGIDKSEQFGKNWVLMCREFYNLASGEDVYLNNPGGRSGNDWWYETMPNIFFYQLNSLYPETEDFDFQFIRIADRWLEAVSDMGGASTPWKIPDMDYRAWSLLEREGLADGVHEPEAAGAIAWILYNAYKESGELKYRIGAEWCIEFLMGLNSNPSYELQLAYGTYTAARMNAESGTDYDITKLMNWCFDIGPLRNWGAIVGNWGGMDCDGLIGEQSAGGTGYAFTMNGFQQAAALIPLLRYDDRYANALGKWILNLSNASRLFYSDYLPVANQDGFTWTNQNDPDAVIAYEALKETLDGKAPFATGDAIRGGWAATNLALYGSSHVGMLGSLIRKTNVEGILQTDLLKTDFYGDDAFSSYLYYNPYNISKEVIIELGSEFYDIYESTNNLFEAYSQTSQYLLEIQPGKSKIIVLVPAGTPNSESFNQRLAGSIIIDYQNGKPVDNFPPRIKSLASADSVVIASAEVEIFCTASDKEEGQLLYRWPDKGEDWTINDKINWTAPENPGYYYIACFVKDAGGLVDSMKMKIRVVDRIISPPVISELNAEQRKLHPGTSTLLSIEATDINNEALNYKWKVSGGTIVGSGDMVNWISPAVEGDYSIKCTVINTDQLESSDSLSVMVRDSNYFQNGNLVAGLSLNGNADDFSAYLNHGTPFNISWVKNRFDKEGFAAGLNGTSSKITVSNDPSLNFVDGLTVIGWFMTNESNPGEQFLISHGSWQNRWKISVNNDFFRFTLNGAAGIIDLDSENEIEPGSWYHLAAVYNGRDLELYLNGGLNSFKAFTGNINSSSYDLTIGQMLPDNANYNFKGSIDDLRIYNYGIRQGLVREIYTNQLNQIDEKIMPGFFTIFPNPAGGEFALRFSATKVNIDRIWIINSAGKIVWNRSDLSLSENGTMIMNTGNFRSGLYLICVLEQTILHTQKLVIH